MVKKGHIANNCDGWILIHFVGFFIFWPVACHYCLDWHQWKLHNFIAWFYTLEPMLAIERHLDWESPVPHKKLLNSFQGSFYFSLHSSENNLKNQNLFFSEDCNEKSKENIQTQKIQNTSFSQICLYYCLLSVTSLPNKFLSLNTVLQNHQHFWPVSRWSKCVFELLQENSLKYDNAPCLNYSILTFPVLVSQQRMADLNVPAKNRAGSVGWNWTQVT